MKKWKIFVKNIFVFTIFIGALYDERNFSITLCTEYQEYVKWKHKKNIVHC